jgi:phosphoribosylamine---glycine ligase
MQLKANNTVLVIDGGGRGSALVEAYGKSKYVGKIIAVPGNDMMNCEIHPELKTTSVKEIIKICKIEKVDLVDVAQDDAIAAGLVDALLKNKIKSIGPSKKAGQIEWDKAWSRKFCQKYNIPQPFFKIFKNEKSGIDFINQQADQSWVIKASGLAGGKGALMAKNNIEAIEKIKEISKFGKASKTYLVEKWLKSKNEIAEEFSTFIFCDGKNYKIIGSAQDHKRVMDGDKGENTGGMGCSAPPLLITPSFLKKIKTNILDKVVKGLKKENRPYKGVLYLGGIVIDNNPFVIEFNARWGDPEAQVLLPSIKTDIYKIANAIIRGKLKNINIKIDKQYRVVVAITSKGYPGDYSKITGKEILGIDKITKTNKVYGAGIKKVNNRYFANGGRLFYVLGEGVNVVDARKNAYNSIKKLKSNCNNLHFRFDIGWRDINRL